MILHESVEHRWHVRNHQGKDKVILFPGGELDR